MRTAASTVRPARVPSLRAALFVLLLVGGPLAGLVGQVQGAAPDRPPTVWAGDDQTVLESPTPCSLTGNANRETCRVVTINTRYSDCPIQDRTFDPDCDSIKYRFRTSQVPCNPNPATGGGVPCIPIGDGSKFLDDTNPPFAAAGQAIIESANCKRAEGTVPGQNPDIRIRNGDDIGFFVFTSPQIPPGHAEGCIYHIDVMAYDGKQRPQQGDEGTAGVTDYTIDVDTVTITVKPDATRPRILLADLDLLLCSRSLRDVIDHQLGVCDDTDAVDIIQHHGQHLVIGYGPIIDDKETRSVQALVNGSELLYPHSFLVPLTEKVVLQPYALNPHQDEISYWFGDLPIDTRALTAGAYDINIRIFDGEGGYRRIEGLDETGEPQTAGELEVTADLLRPDDEPSAPCSDPGGNAPCLFINKAPQAPRPNACFSGVSRTAPYVLGKGFTLRPEAYWAYVNPAVDDPRLSPIFDRELMKWRVTYQSCVLSIQDGVAVPSLGPETELALPYYLSLDTLFAGPQEVAVRAYDRIGSERAEVVIPLVEDQAAPRYAMPPRMLQTPVVTYQDLQAQLVVFVHDDVDSLVTLHINRFNETSTGKAIPYDYALFSGATSSDRNGTAVVLPRLDAITKLDLFGAQDFKTTCDYLFDRDGDGIVDVYYHWANHTLGRIIGEEDPLTGDVRFVVDRNSNGIADTGEPVVKADVVGDEEEATLVLQGTNKCIDPFQGQPHLQAWFAMAPTQVFAFNVTRHLLGETTYSIAVRDVLFGNLAPGRMGFNYTVDGAKTAAPVSFLQGTLDTRLAVVDAMVVEAKLVNDDPILFGDAVAIAVKVKQTSAVDPAPAAGAEPVVPLTILLFEPSTSNPECLDRARSDCLKVCIAPPAVPHPCVIPDVQHGQEVTATGSRPYGRIGPTGLDTTGIIPEFADPGLAAIAASPYRPGIHNVVAGVYVPDTVKEHDVANDEQKVTFEVYAGLVVVGAMPGNSEPSGRVFWIRALSSSGFPQIRGGAVELDATGKVTDSYDLRLNETADLPRYDFTYTDSDGTSKVAYWEPQTRYSRTFGKDCDDLSAAEKVVDYSVTPVKDPRCRPVTVITPTAADPVVERDSPGAGLVALLAALGVAFLLRRRK